MYPYLTAISASPYVFHNNLWRLVEWDFAGQMSFLPATSNHQCQSTERTHSMNPNQQPLLILHSSTFRLLI